METARHLVSATPSARSAQGQSQDTRPFEALRDRPKNAAPSSSDKKTRHEPERKVPRSSATEDEPATATDPRYRRAKHERSTSSKARPDSAINGYQLGDCLGKGAFGSVFRALNMGTGETVAVKQIKMADLPKSELRVITLEIDLLKNLDHPNIVKYRGFEQSAESLNIILEYCENGSLHTISKNFGKFPENLVGIYMSQVLHGLLYLHEQGVIHRDIKGANILTTKQGLVKLADFGVATRTTAFHESSVVGTPYWMAPEVIELSGATTASDIWSLGCTVIELLDGRPPYHKLQPMHALFRIVNDDHPPLPDGSSPVVRDFLMQCFQKDPNLRVSARKLLKHPWIVNAKRSDAIVPKKPTEYNEAVRSVQEWNKALKAPGVTQAPRALASSPIPAETTRAQSKSAEDLWDDDFAADDLSLALATRQARTSSKSGILAGILPNDKLRSFASLEITTDDSNWDENFEGELTIRSPFQKSPVDQLAVRSKFHKQHPKLDTAKARPTNGLSTDGPSSTDAVSTSPSDQRTNRSDARERPSFDPPDTQINRRPGRLRPSAQIQQYAEDALDEDFSDVFATIDSGRTASEQGGSDPGTLILSTKFSNKSWGDEEDDDPFAKLEEAFDELDLEANVARDKFAQVCTQIESLVASLNISQGDDALQSVSKHLLEHLISIPETRSVLIEAHGMLPMLEILEVTKQRDVILNLLRAINMIIIGDVDTQENLCFVGGIPIITKYASKKYPSEVRIEAAAFIRQMYQTSSMTLQMFVSAGGLKTLVEFLEEDYEEERELVLIGVNGIWSVFELQGPTPKNDFCRILSRTSVLDPLSLVLSRVLDEGGKDAELCEGRIANIFFLFSQAETYVKELIAERTVLHRESFRIAAYKQDAKRKGQANAGMLKELRRMSPLHQVTMLKFIKNLSMLSTTLDALQNSNAIDVLIELLRETIHRTHRREIWNQVLNTIYNLCRLNKSRQEDAALNGIVPVLQRIISSKDPLKEFALPVLCDMASSGKVGRRELWRNKGLAFYVSLLADEFWQVTALDAIFVWLQEETAKVEEHLLRGNLIEAIIRCFTDAKANAFENLLEPLQKLLRLSPPVAHSMAGEATFGRVLQKLHSGKAVVRLNLLRIVRSICEASEEAGASLRRYGLQATIERLADSDSAVLVRNLASDLLRLCDSDHNGLAKRTTLNLLSRSSTPTTPARGPTSYFPPDRHRPRESVNSSPLSLSSTASSVRSRLPRTTSIGGKPHRPSTHDHRRQFQERGGSTQAFEPERRWDAR